MKSACKRSMWCIFMMTSSNGIIFCVTGHLRGEFTGDRWIPLTKASDAELWCFLWSAPEQRVEQTNETLGFDTLSRSSWRQCNDLHLIWCHCKVAMGIFGPTVWIHVIGILGRLIIILFRLVWMFQIVLVTFSGDYRQSKHICHKEHAVNH